MKEKILFLAILMLLMTGCVSLSLNTSRYGTNVGVGLETGNNRIRVSTDFKIEH